MPGLTLIVTTALLLAPATTSGIGSKLQDEKVLEVKNAIHQQIGPSSVDLHTLDIQKQSDKPQTIAQKYGGNPHGPDPHGDDPHDETYDAKMPANKKRNFNKAPKDVYGGKYPNTQAPY